MFVFILRSVYQSKHGVFGPSSYDTVIFKIMVECNIKSLFSFVFPFDDLDKVTGNANT